MARRPRRKFSEETKEYAVAEFVSGRKSAPELAEELDVPIGQIYKWKSTMGERRREERVTELTETGLTKHAARLLQQKEDEIAAYQKKVAELTVINDLLKKLQNPQSSQSESELSGWIETSKRSAQKRKPVKR